MSDTVYSCFDVETTGLDSRRARVIEIAVVKVTPAGEEWESRDLAEQVRVVYEVFLAEASLGQDFDAPAVVTAPGVTEVEVSGLGRLCNSVAEIPAPAHDVGHQPTDTPMVRGVALGSDARTPGERTK